MRLETIEFGRIYSFLRKKNESLIQHCRSGDSIDAVLKEFASHPVFRETSSAHFRAPVPDQAPEAHALQKSIMELEKLLRSRQLEPATKNSVQNIVTGLKTFLKSFRECWYPDDSYFIIPVIAESRDRKTKRPGLMYLRSEPLGSFASQANAWSGLQIDGLTQDRGLLSAATDYFGDLVMTMLNALYYANPCPPDFFKPVSSRRYRLYFDCRITHGRSLGAAVLALFAVVHIRTLLGSAGEAIVSPRCGTIISGEIDPHGNILQVESLDEKIRCAYEEYGPDIKVIVPAGQELPDDIAIDGGNLFYVSTVEDLLNAALSSETRPNALNAARAELFKRLDESDIRQLKQRISEGVDKNIYEMIARDGYPSDSLIRSKGGCYCLSKAWHNQVDFRIGLEPKGLEETAGAQSADEQLIVIVDGSGGQRVEEYWVKNEKSRHCKITDIVFEIAKSFDKKRQKLAIGFLSHRKYYDVEYGTIAETIEDELQNIRDDDEIKLRSKGAFSRPVLEACLDAYPGKSFRIFVIADSYIPDLYDDYLDPRFLSLVRFYISPPHEADAEHHRAESPPEPAREKHALALYKDGTLDRRLLHRYFKCEEGKIISLKIECGNRMPVEWLPANGDLIHAKKAGGLEFTLEWKDIREIYFKTWVQYQSACPTSFRIGGRVTREGEDGDFQFEEYPNNMSFNLQSTFQKGELGDADFERWREMCDEGNQCRTCGERDVHLYHYPEAGIEKTPIFSDKRIAQLNQQYLVMQKGRREFFIFTTGCRLNGLCLVKADGELYWSKRGGHLEKTEIRAGSSYFKAGDGEFYITLL